MEYCILEWYDCRGLSKMELLIKIEYRNYNKDYFIFIYMLVEFV